MDSNSSNLKHAVYDLSYEKEYAKKTQVLEPRKETRVERPSRKRKNINKLDDTNEKETLRIAIDASIRSGDYAKLVTLHSQFMFDIHSFRGTAWVNQRFLPWHRVYLVKFEEMLNMVIKKRSLARIIT